MVVNNTSMIKMYLNVCSIQIQLVSSKLIGTKNNDAYI